jgi:hypothetical protein
VPSTTQPPFRSFIYKHLTRSCDLQINFLILQSDASHVNDRFAASKVLWSKTLFAILIRYMPPGIYFSRIRVRGKLIRRSLKTTGWPSPGSGWGDLEKIERQRIERQGATGSLRMVIDGRLVDHTQCTKTRCHQLNDDSGHVLK